MSGKFKPGDLVELLEPMRPVLDPNTKHLRTGNIGEIVCYVGTDRNSFATVHNGWEVKFPGDSSNYVIDERILRLIPGGDEYLSTGKWDQCPWSPYKKKTIDANDITDACFDFL